MKKSKFLTLAEIKFTTRISANPGKDNLLRKEKKESFNKAFAKVGDDPVAKEWLEGHKDLW